MNRYKLDRNAIKLNNKARILFGSIKTNSKSFSALFVVFDSFAIIFFNLAFDKIIFK